MNLTKDELYIVAEALELYKYDRNVDNSLSKAIEKFQFFIEKKFDDKRRKLDSGTATKARFVQKWSTK